MGVGDWGEIEIEMHRGGARDALSESTAMRQERLTIQEKSTIDHAKASKIDHTKTIIQKFKSIIPKTNPILLLRPKRCKPPPLPNRYSHSMA